MDNEHGIMGVSQRSCAIAAAGGFLAAIIFWFLFSWGFFWGLIAGLIVAIAIFYWYKTKADNSGPADSQPIPSTPAKTETKPTAVEPAAPGLEAATEPAATKPKDKPAPKTAATKEPAAKKEAEASTTAAGSRPALMKDAPDGGQADDLKKISGVGPKLEQTLNGLGIWHFEQVAALNQTDIAWVDERLTFKGRIVRDDWVGQAKKLAKDKG